jgi:general secretion pathway protein D
MKGRCMRRSVWLAALLAGLATGMAAAQLTPPSARSPEDASRSTGAHQNAKPAETPSGPEHTKAASGKDRRRAAKLFLEASKLFEKEQFDEALRDYEQAAAWDPANPDYALAAKVARSHAVTALIQTAAKARLRGDAGAARAALQQALELDPGNAVVAQHLQELAGDAFSDPSKPLYEEAARDLEAAPVLTPPAGLHSFHLRMDRRQLIQNVFKAYGIEATVDSSIPSTPVRLDLDDAKFEQAARILGMVTDSFWVPLDAHRVLVAKDARAERQQFVREEMETIYLSGLTAAELTDVGNLAKNVFEVQRAVVATSLGTLTIRAPARTLDAFNATLRELLDGRSQVLLEVRMIQLAHTSQRNTGAQLPQQMTAFNVYAEEQAILNANQGLVQQIISSGLAAPGDTLAILGILLASGQVTSSIFSNGIALFGGGLTLSGLSPGPATLNLSLNSSDSRELDQIQLRLGDGEEGTLRTGMRYPIMTSSFSGLSSSSVNIPGLTSAGSSSSLSSLISSLAGAATQIPQVEYQDLGLTLKATPNVMRNGDVALTMDMKITALAGTSLNGVPVLNNRNYSGVVTLKEGAAVVVASELDEQESRALSGTPGITEIPGLNNLTGKATQKDFATLLIIISPHVIRGPQAAGRSAMMRVEQNMSAQ